LGFEGRLDVVLKLHQLGMPRTAIAELLRVGPSTVERDLVLAADAEMRGHIRSHFITATNAATLLQAAEKAGRSEEFMDFLRGWLRKAAGELEAEEKTRVERDEPPLPASKRWLQNRMSAELVAAWKHALENRQVLGGIDPTLKFRAFVHGEGESARVEIGAVSKQLGEMNSADVAKIVRRCLDLASELEPVLVKKAAAEKQASTPAGGGKAISPGLKRLMELGVAADVREASKPDEGGDESAETHFDQVEDQLLKQAGETA
jgi:hypothetical protein